MRAYVFAKHYRWVNNVRVDGDTHTTVNYRNSGQTPAYGLVLNASLRVGGKPPSPSRAVFRNTKEHSVYVAIDPKVAINLGPLVNLGRKVTPNEIAAIRKRQMRMYVFGVFSCRDVLTKNRHHSYFCFAYTGLTTNTQDTPKLSRYCSAFLQELQDASSRLEECRH